MIRLVDRVTGQVVFVPNAWVSWTIGNLHFKRVTVGDCHRVITWRRRGEGRWHSLNLEPAIDRVRERRGGWVPVQRAS